MPTTNIAQGCSSKETSLVVVVDDDASFLRAMGRLLRTAGYTVETFGSPAKFLAAVTGLSPKVLVLDVHMPEMTGLELQERLAALGICLPVIFVTAHDTPQTRERAQKAGSFGLLLKPFDKSVLLRAINAALSFWNGCEAC
jgi:FixJ family two-component response regulator